MTTQNGIDTGYLDASPRIGCYYDGPRVEITYKDGYTPRKKRGKIGRSSGPKPCYILLARRNSRGGEQIADSDIEDIRAVPARISNQRYRELAKAQHEEEGTLEIDDKAKVSRGDDGGAYVQAWVWVYDPEQ